MGRLSGLYLRPDDPPATVQRKKLAMNVFLGCGTSAALALALSALTISNATHNDMNLAVSMLLWLSLAATTAVNVAAVAITVATKDVSDRLVTVYAFLMSLVVALLDLDAIAAGAERRWILWIVIIDFCVVVNAPGWVRRYVLYSALLWTFVASAEMSYRLGLADMHGTLPQDTRRLRQCETCDALPCGRGTVQFISFGFTIFFVLIVDSQVTQKFARSLSEEKDVMARTIAVTGTIAENLVEFDLAAARAHLRGERAAIPRVLHDHLHDLITNLEMYRPFLPDSLFEEQGAVDTGGPAFPKQVLEDGGGEVVGTVVFTDIRSSSTIWRAAPDSMKRALRVHNKVIRKQVAAFNAYEVKTIGDAFMIAFTDLDRAVAFSLAVHDNLLHANWPEELLRLPECLRKEDVWGGLAVRIGIAEGETSVELNELTGRWDYFGHAVNVAARLEAASAVGGIAMLHEQFSRLERNHAVAVISRETMVLRGVNDSSAGDASDVICITPQALQRRKHCPHSIDFATRTSLVELGTDGDTSSGNNSAGSGGADGHDSDSSGVSDGMGSVGSGSAAPRSDSFVSVGSCGRRDNKRRFPHPRRDAGAVTYAPSSVAGAVQLDVPIAEDAAGAQAMAATISALLSKVLVAVGRTTGSVGGLYGTIVTASWGVVRKSASHGEDAFHFVHLLQEAVAEEEQGAPPAKAAPPPFHVGLCAGASMAGSVGTMQKFLTVFGLPVFHAARLCLAAQDNGICALYGAVTESHSPAMHPNIDPFLEPYAVHKACPVSKTNPLTWTLELLYMVRLNGEYMSTGRRESKAWSAGRRGSRAAPLPHPSITSSDDPGAVGEDDAMQLDTMDS